MNSTPARWVTAFVLLAAAGLVVTSVEAREGFGDRLAPELGPPSRPAPAVPTPQRPAEPPAARTAAKEPD